MYGGWRIEVLLKTNGPANSEVCQADLVELTSYTFIYKSYYKKNKLYKKEVFF